MFWIQNSLLNQSKIFIEFILINYALISKKSIEYLFFQLLVKKIKDKGNKDRNEKKLKINILKSKINKSLKEGFEYIYQLAMNNKELNADVLSEDKEKYGYSKQILKENMEKKIIKILLIYLL